MVALNRPHLEEKAAPISQPASAPKQFYGYPLGLNSILYIYMEPLGDFIRRRTRHSSQLPRVGGAPPFFKSEHDDEGGVCLLAGGGAGMGAWLCTKRGMQLVARRLPGCFLDAPTCPGGRIAEPFCSRSVCYMGGCQNHGPFLGTLNIRCRIIIGIQKGTIILTTTNHMLVPHGVQAQVSMPPLSRHTYVCRPLKR